MIFAIFAIDENNGLGLNNSMPWPKNHEDLNWFKETTQGHVVVMGKNTWESKGMPKPLPGRLNIVFSSKLIDNPYANTVSGDVCSILLDLNKNYSKVFVIGGANLLTQSLPVIEEAFITKIPGNYHCDTVIDLNSFLKDFSLQKSYIKETCIIEHYKKN